jgi:predicted nucleic acid-binding protein
MIMADTGFWVALFSPNDQHHELAQHTLKQLNERLITTYPVLTETCHLLLKRSGQQAVIGFMNSYAQGAFLLYHLDQDYHPKHIITAMKKYADLPMDLADASLVILADHLGHGRILTTDARDFNTYRWKSHHPFDNLMCYSN